MINIKISNRVLYTFIAVIIIIAIIGIGYAYNTGGPPSTIGHSADEIELPSDVCRADGTGCGFLYSGLCVVSTGWYSGSVYCTNQTAPASCYPGLLVGNSRCICPDGYVRVPLGEEDVPGGATEAHTDSYYTCFKQ